LFILILSVFSMIGCGGGEWTGHWTPGKDVALTSIKVTPTTALIPITGFQQFTATARYSDGTSRDVTSSSIWTSGTPGVATVSPTTGVAVGVTSGTSIITAAFGGMTDFGTLNVSAVTLQSIMVTPVAASIPRFGTQQYMATAIFSDGSTLNVTAAPGIAWTSVDVAPGVGIATVGAGTGLATGNAVGQATITAAYGGKTASATLTVLAKTLTQLNVTPTPASIPVLGAQQFTAIATYNDGSTLNVTANPGATWASATPAVAANPINGLAIGLTPGTSNITATFGGMTSNIAVLNVVAKVLLSIDVTPTLASIPLFGTQQFTAIARYNDGSTLDVTTNVNNNWAAADVFPGVGVASIDNTPGSPTKGRATGNAVGQSNITATFGGMTSNIAVLTVNAKVLMSIDVTPALASIPVLGTQQYKALAIYNDGSTLDVTTNLLTTWTATDVVGTGVATIGSGTGLATGNSVGQARIRATYLTQTDSEILTVTAPNPGPAGAVDLKTTAPFGIIAYDAITISGGHVYGDVALTQPGPGGTIASVTGAGTNDSGIAPMLASSNVTTSDGVNPGVIVAADNGSPIKIAALPQLLVDLRAVYDDLMARAAPVTPLTTALSAVGKNGGTFAAATDLSGYVLSPGIFTTAVTYGLSNTFGPLVLDAGGNPDAVFIIRSTSAASGFTSTTGSVVLQNGANAKNVFWVMNNLTIGTTTFFQGTVVAGNVITLNTFANAEGRMLAGALGVASGAITLSGTNVITVPK
jgi:hypothetical protein